ncbi:hypothetical protein D3C73_1393530 [compost metagenome]
MIRSSNKLPVVTRKLRVSKGISVSTLPLKNIKRAIISAEPKPNNTPARSRCKSLPPIIPPARIVPTNNMMTDHKVALEGRFLVTIVSITTPIQVN